MKDRENEHRLGYYFKLIHLRFEKYYQQNFQDCDLTMAQMTILMFLLENKDYEIFLKDIEKYMGISHPTAVGTIQRLEKKGLVVTETNCGDKRFRRIIATKEAEAVNAAMIAHRLKMDQLIVKNMTADEVTTLNSLLVKVLNNLSQEKENK